MSKLWKILVAINLALSAVILLIMYALTHPNPYSRQYYEQEQLKMDLRQVRQELDAMKSAQISARKALLSEQSIYFGADQFSIGDKFKPVIAEHAGFIKESGLKVMIEGNTDKQSTPEFALAIGQKRAEAVRAALLASGVPASQMDTVSLGSEKPKAKGTDATARAENRRVDLVYQ